MSLSNSIAVAIVFFFLKVNFLSFIFRITTRAGFEDGSGKIKFRSGLLFILKKKVQQT